MLCANGPDDDPKIRLEVVDQNDGDLDAVEGWEPRPFDLSKGNVPGLVTAPRGVLVAGGCGFWNAVVSPPGAAMSMTPLP